MENKPTSHFLAGTIIGAVGIILFLAYYFAGISFKRNFLTWIPSLITIALIILFIMQYGKANDYRASFGNLFGYGFKITAIYTLIMTLVTLLVVFLLPDFKEQYMEEVYNQMDAQANMPEEQKEAAIKITEKFFNIIFIGSALFINMLIGTIASLIGSAVTKKKPQTPFDNKY